MNSSISDIISESDNLNETYETQFTIITNNFESQYTNNSDFNNDSTDTIKENETNTLTTEEYNSSISDTIKESENPNEFN